MDTKSDIVKDTDFSKWLSTYGLITVERMLALLHLYPKQTEILAAVNDSENIYHLLLRVPFKNVLNNIIMEQTSDYREYGQKFFITYLMSGVGNETEENPIQQGSSRDRMEEERQSFVALGDQLDLLVFEHHKLIAESQKALIALVVNLKERYESVLEYDKDLITSTMADFESRTQTFNVKLRHYRTQFYDAIVRSRDLANSIPEYHPDLSKLTENREFLYFDGKLGDRPNE